MDEYKSIDVNIRNPDKYDRIIMRYGGYDACRIFLTMLREKDKEIEALQKKGD